MLQLLATSDGQLVQIYQKKSETKIGLLVLQATSATKAFFQD